MILVDTSVWIDHLRKGSPKLTTLLLNDWVLMHPFVIGEIALGSLKNRTETLDLFTKLPAAALGSHAEALTFLERHRLFGKGLGYIDIHLLISATLSQAKLWTLDKRLSRQASLMRLHT